jgi:glycosyltransferase involved in cell wall biosynthesis
MYRQMARSSTPKCHKQEKIKSLFLCMISRDLFGAEKRYTKIFKRILAAKQDYNLFLVTNSSFYILAKNHPFAASVISEIAIRNRLIVIPDQLSHLLHAKNIIKFFRALVSNSVRFHCLLRGDLLGYIKCILGGKSIIEITSVDVARRIGELVPRILLRRIDKFVCVSETVKSKFCEIVSQRGLPIASEKIRAWHIPYFDAPIDTSYSKEKIITSASRFIRRKNVLLFARSLSLALPHLTDWKVFILGQGEQETEIRSILQPWIDNGQVAIGYTKDPVSHLQKSLLYVSLIEPDNYPSQGVLEAMATGNALMLSDTGSSYKFISPELPNGILVKLDEKEIAEQLKKLCVDINTLHMMATNSKRILSSKFNPNMFIRDLFSLHDMEYGT